MNILLRLLLLGVIPLLVSCGKSPRQQLEEMSISFTPQGFCAAAQAGNTNAVSLFLKAGMKADAASEAGWTPLTSACHGNQPETVRILLESGANPNENGGAKDGLQQLAAQSAWELGGASSPKQPDVSPLMIAAHQGNTDIAKLLLDKGANPNATNAQKTTAINWAASNKHFDFVVFLANAKADPNLANNQKQTPLLFASAHGHAAAVQALLKAGANPNLPDREGQSPLMLAALNSSAEITESLLAGGADPDLTDKNGSTALMAALTKKNVHAAALILKKTKNVNQQAARAGRYTALMFAAMNGTPEIVTQLLERGADVNIRADQNVTALMLSCLHKRSDLVKLLIARGADLNLKENLNENTALLTAINKGDLESVKLLLEAGADPNLGSKDGFTPLMLAAQNGQDAMAQALIEKKANPDTGASGGKRAGLTALMVAAVKGHANIAQMLLAAGANPGVRDSAGATAWMYARHNRQEEIAELLKNAEAAASSTSK
ncbi:MAG: ankyrin repeat domain-containing protein [Verrucomicrobiae bacterium]|nr:ankyrin repeat domain-containing protein [Verrucomicrobiae bacterium]